MTADFAIGTVELAHSPEFRLGRATVRPALRQVESPGRTETLEPRVMQVLVVLAERPGHVVPKDELIKRCWGGRIVGDDAVTQCIAKVRRSGMAHGAFALQAVPRVGYRLAVIEGGLNTRRTRAIRPRGVLLMLLAVLLLGAVTATAWMLRPVPLSGLNADATVAVLPFRTLSPDAQAGRFAASVTEEVSGRLTNVGLPLLPSKSRVRHFILDGTVLRENDTLKVRARLRESGSGAVLWTDDFAAPASEESRLRTQLGWRLTAIVQIGREALTAPSRDLTPEVLGLMLQARDNVRQSNWKARDPIEQVVRLAPRYARGHAELALSLTASAHFTDGERANLLIRRARQEGQRAVALAPKDPFALAARSLTLDGKDWTGRERLLRAAEALLPPETPTPWTLEFLLDTGRVREGVLMAQQFIPGKLGQPMAAGGYVSTLYLSDAKPEALARVDEYLLIRPTDGALLRGKMLMTLISGDPDEALGLLDRPDLVAPHLGGPAGRTALRDVALARKSGSPADHAKAVVAVVAAAQARQLNRPDGIRLLAALGAVDEALTMAEAYAADPRTTRTANFFEPRFLFAADLAPLRRSPRFVGVVERLGLVTYWRQTAAWPDFCGTEPSSVCERIKRGG